MTSCQYEEAWSRAFTLSDFGISTADQFIITTGQVAISNSYDGAQLVFNFYSLNSETPGRNPQRISYGNVVLAPEIGDTPEIVQINFSTPITIPAGVERILVEVTQMDDIYNDEYKEVLIAGTEFDNDTSWFKGCREYYTPIPTENLSTPVPHANFFINVTGKIQNIASSGSSVTLSHNVCDDIIETSIHSCTSSYIYWARDFYLEDFGISTNEEFVITSGQVGVNKVGWLPEISFNVYAIDDNFPSSFSETDLIGSSQYQQLSPNIDRNSRIINVDFDTAVVVPAGVERILVEVHKGIVYGDGVAFIAGSTQDTGISWQRGCVTGGPHSTEYVSTEDFGRPDAKFYINVTGDVNHVTNDFSLNISNVCSEFLKEFSVAPTGSIASITWDFGDPASGGNNTSTDASPFHDFSTEGTYTITATVISSDGNAEVLTETINVKEPPNAYGIDNIYACEDSFNTGISSSFNLAQVTQQILRGQNNMTVTFIDGSGNEFTTLSSPFTNTIKDRETIGVRVAHNNNLCCYSETTFDLIVNPVPDLSAVSDLLMCSNEANGFATFDLEQVQNDILGNNNATSVSFFRENGNQIQAPLNAIKNQTINEEKITVRAFGSVGNCYEETPLVLRTSSQPQLNMQPPVYACDKGNGFGNFDLSKIESEIIGNQVGLKLSYFDTTGAELPSPLSTSYENKVSWKETITVRAENSMNTLCYAETSFDVIVNELPTTMLESSYYLCHLEPSLPIQIENNFDYYSWSFEDNSIISDTHKVDLINAGSYTLTLGKITNGVYCEKNFNFEFIKSSPPTITEVKHKGLSDTNFIEIIASGNGDFEYSLDGINFKKSNYFFNIIGGTYTALVRDKNGCGEDVEEVTILDYPKFFTPNNDGQNDYWQIYGIDQFPSSRIFIYDRYGKLLVQLSSNDLGWDGLFNGREMVSSDYWFKANLGEGTIFSGHFTLKR
ncbi:hypothetical protein DHD08_12160 [Arenibacter sp. H213]|nr:hypothetical protein [Arenibacter sp. H213]